nr:nucleoside diphosphate kinase regulator [uncultured Sphingomonas sp.]
MTNIKTAPARKPAIHLSETDYDVIANLALQMEARNPVLSRQILDEIDRAKIYAAAKLPKDVVSIGSEVTFADDSSGSTRTVRLVMPGEADIGAGQVSIMTPVGAGLIGMSIGREIEWPRAEGKVHALKILDVKQSVG